MPCGTVGPDLECDDDCERYCFITPDIILSSDLLMPKVALKVGLFGIETSITCTLFAALEFIPDGVE